MLVTASLLCFNIDTSAHTNCLINLLKNVLAKNSLHSSGRTLYIAPTSCQPFSIIFFNVYFQNLKNKFIIVILSFFLIFLKFYLLSFNYSFDMSLTEPTFLSDLHFSYEKSLFILTHIIIALFKYPIWVLFIFILYANKKYKKNLDVIYFSSISISLIFIIYLFNDIEDYKWLISGSLDRLIFQASGFLIIFVSDSLNSIIKRFKY